MNATYTKGGAIIPIGFSGNTIEIFESLERNYEIPAILDDDPSLHGTSFEGVPILPLTARAGFPHARFLCLVGSEHSFRKREKIIAGLGLGQDRFATFTDSSSRVSRFAAIGSGVVLYPGVTVTSNGRISDHVLIMPHSIVHHDVRIGACSLIGASVILAGGVSIGESCYIGSGTSVRNGVSIGNGALIGMGSVVVCDVPPRAVVAGNPARLLQRKEE